MKVWTVMIGLLGTCLCLSLYMGAATLTPSDIVSGLLGRGAPDHITIVRDIRLPRALVAALIGAGLGASGAALQAFTRNPLADPGILGFSACAAFGAVLALYFGFASWVPVSALVGAAIGAALILILTGVRKSAATLILAGVGIGALATAMTGLLMNFAPNPWALSEIVFWLMGSLRHAELSSLWTLLPLTLIGLGLLIAIASDLNVMSLGEDTAQSLGVSLVRVRVLLVIGVALCVGGGVAIAGTIGFVGLFIPHILRAIVGANPMRLIPASACGGAIFLLLADIATRAASGPGTPLYIGVLSALIGVPFFLYLAVRETRL